METKALGLLAHKSLVSGLSNEVYNVSVQQLVLEIRAVKVERSKKKPVLLRKSGFFFDRSTLTARISRTSCRTETLYTSFKSPNLQLFIFLPYASLKNLEKQVRVPESRA